MPRPLVRPIWQCIGGRVLNGCGLIVGWVDLCYTLISFHVAGK
jgi:hypothetical protein